MVRPGLQFALLVCLITVGWCVHLLSKLIVHHGFGLIALVLLFAALKPLSRYLD